MSENYMEMVGGIVKKSMQGVMCCLCCCFPLINAVNICALVFAFQENLQEDNDSTTAVGEEYDVCGKELNDDAFMTVSHHLIIAGAGGIALSIIQMMAAAIFLRAFTETVDLAISEGSETDKFQRQMDTLQTMQNLVRFLSTLPIMCLQLAWSIAGFILYSQVGGDCTASSPGKMLLAWCIIVMVSACSSFNQVTKPQNLDAAFGQMFISVDAVNAQNAGL